MAETAETTSSPSSSSTAMPSEAAIRSTMEKLVVQVDIEKITTKQFIAMLSQEFGGVDLSTKKKYIKATLTEVLDALEREDETSEEEEEEEEPPTKKRRGSGGLAAVKAVSEELAQFLGQGKEMARTEVVKGLWAYIKEHNLQNPDDKREIILDERMKSLFHCDRFTMFTMNKYVNMHMHPFTPVNLNELSENSKKKKQDAAERRKAKAEQKKNGEKKGKRKPGMQAPWRLSPDLIKVVEKEILPRPQVIQRLWIYIRKHQLQNPENKREIICDDKFKVIMDNQDRVNIFTLTKHITPHMLEKLDKSAYVHEEIDDDGNPIQLQTSNSFDNDDMNESKLKSSEEIVQVKPVLSSINNDDTDSEADV